MKISVLTICTREKRYDHPRKLLRRDFAELSRRLWREDELGHLRCAAGAFYTGLPMRRLGSGIGTARRGGLEVDYWILSAGYGLLHERMPVVPYDCSFNGMDAALLAEWGQHLSLPDTAPMVLAAPAALRLVLLTDPYLRACQLRPDTPLAAPTVFVVSRRTAGRLPSGSIPWVLGRDDVVRFGTPAVALRQELGARALRLLAREGQEGLDRLLAAGEGWRAELAPSPRGGGPPRRR
jgi:hypothetical protein